MYPHHLNGNTVNSHVRQRELAGCHLERRAESFGSPEEIRRGGKGSERWDGVLVPLRLLGRGS